jgi:Cupin
LSKGHFSTASRERRRRKGHNRGNTETARYRWFRTAAPQGRQCHRRRPRNWARDGGRLCPRGRRCDEHRYASPYTDSGTIPNLKFSFAAARNRLLTGGWAREVTVRELPAATEQSGVNMRLKPGGIRELHWHKESEWAFMLAGRARITAVDEQGRTFIDDVPAITLFPGPLC